MHLVFFLLPHPFHVFFVELPASYPVSIDEISPDWALKHQPTNSIADLKGMVSLESELLHVLNCCDHEYVDGQRQRVNVPTYAWTAHDGLAQKRLEEDLCWIVPHSPRRHFQSRDWTELNVSPIQAASGARRRQTRLLHEVPLKQSCQLFPVKNW